MAMRLVLNGARPFAGFDVAYSMARSVCGCAAAAARSRHQIRFRAHCPAMSSCVQAKRTLAPAPLPPAGEGGAQRRVRVRLLISRVRGGLTRPHPNPSPAGGRGASIHDRRSRGTRTANRSEEHTSELQSLMRTSYAVFCLKKKQNKKTDLHTPNVR